ncbi:corrinoid protein-associated methyltransferase CpaM [Thermodesulfobacteriota bacterium]
MFSYLFMKILEGRPRSYDRRMDAISRGRIGLVKEDVALEIPQGARVLEIGCGTAELASILVAHGAQVTAFDPNAAMIEVARERVNREGIEGRLTIKHMGVEGMDCFASAHYDAVVSTLVLSELSDQERRFALTQAKRVLKSRGIIVIADEVVPRRALSRILQALFRLPLIVSTYLVSRNTTRPIADLPGELKSAGFAINKEIRSHGDAFALVTGSLPEKS